MGGASGATAGSGGDGGDGIGAGVVSCSMCLQPQEQKLCVAEAPLVWNELKKG
jgi:hypothetical protein